MPIAFNTKMWYQIVLMCIFGFSKSVSSFSGIESSEVISGVDGEAFYLNDEFPQLTTSFDLGAVVSGNRMAGVPLGKTLGAGEVDVEGVCQQSGVACQNCTHTVTCVALPLGWLKVPLQECPEGQTCNAHEGGCSDHIVPECDAIGQKFQHICEQVGIFPDAYDCRKFHLCSPPDGIPNGRAADHRTALCPAHYGFDPKNAQCSIKLHRGQCIVKPVPDCEHVGQMGVLPSSPNHYYVCLARDGNLYPQVFICPHGWIYSGGYCREDRDRKPSTEVQNRDIGNENEERNPNVPPYESNSVDNEQNGVDSRNSFGPGDENHGHNGFGPNLENNGQNGNSYGPGNENHGHGGFGPHLENNGPNISHFGPGDENHGHNGFGPNLENNGQNGNSFGPGDENHGHGRFGPNIENHDHDHSDSNGYPPDSREIADHSKSNFNPEDSNGGRFDEASNNNNYRPETEVKERPLTHIEKFFSTERATTHAPDTFLADKFPEVANYESTDDGPPPVDDFANSFETGFDFWQ